jgi:hypothetical protein
MPYANEHACRLNDPGKYVRMRRQNGAQKHEGKPIDVIYGVHSGEGPQGGKTEIQALRFPKDHWSESSAHSVCSARGGGFEAASKEGGIMASLEDYPAYALYIEPSASLELGPRRFADSIIIQRFKKDLLKVGDYTHPTEGWELKVTPEKLQQYKLAYEKMQKNGVDVEATKNHSHLAEDVLGKLVDGMTIGPDDDGKLTLWGIHEIRGEDSIELAQKCPRVSVEIDKDFVDGKGNHYGEAITKVSIVQKPVVSGQGDFIPVKKAASMYGAADSIPVLCMSSETNFNFGDNNMDNEFLKKIGMACGIKEGELTEANAVEKLGSIFKKLNDKIEEQDREMKKRKKSDEGNGSNDNEKSLSENVNLQETIASTGEKQLSLLVGGGKLTPAVAKKLGGILIGESGGRNIKMLSCGKSGEKALLFQICEALEDLPSFGLGKSKTGVQMFSREQLNADTDDKTKKSDAQIAANVEAVNAELAGSKK